MGAGKTSAGRLLAEKLAWRFVDLDDCIRDRERRSIAEIFRDSGEDHFRRIEAECLSETLSQSERLVLALGGGAFVQPRNAELIRAAGVRVVFLDATPEVLFRRCALQEGLRPLLADENQFRQLYESRREGYMAAGVRVDTTALSPDQVVDEVLNRLDLQRDS